MLLPLISFSQSEVSVSFNGVKVTQIEMCPFYVIIDDSSHNLLEPDMYTLLLKQDSFRIESSFDGFNFKSEKFGLVNKVKDHLIVEYHDSVSIQEAGLYVTHANNVLYSKIKISTLGDNCTYYINEEGFGSECSFGPAYYLNGKPVFHENPVINRKLKRKYRKWKSKQK